MERIHPKFKVPIFMNEVIIDKLYISDEFGASDHEYLAEKKITHILIVGKYLQARFPDKFQYLQLEVDDLRDQSLTPYFQQAFDFIEKGERVLIHCAAGVSRSPSFVIAYLMMKNGFSYQDAYDLLKKARSVIDPNEGFVKQLKEFEKLLLAQRTT